jgi:hypothetical protein
VIQVQAYRWNAAGAGSFTINLGVSVHSSDVAFIAICGAATPNVVKVTDCMVRTRIGAPMDDDGKGDRLDYWWDFDVATDLALLGREVAGILATRAVPFLKQFDSLESILGFLLEHENHTLQLSWSVSTPRRSWSNLATEPGRVNYSCKPLRSSLGEKTPSMQPDTRGSD